MSSIGMASLVNALLCALVGTAFWTVLGHALGRHLLPRVLAFGAAPVLGWAVFSALTLPIVTLAGFSLPAVIGVVILCLVAAGASLLLPGSESNASGPAISPWGFSSGFAAAAVLALVPASALVPKFSNGGVHLGDQIFDHAKIAIVDAMTRQGLPPVNPVFGAFGAAGRLAYYYLWHFSAAALALPLHISGWEADIGLTWFTAFASLTLMMGIAVWLSKRAEAAVVVVALAAGASLWKTLSFFVSDNSLAPFLQGPTGFAGWLFQSSWVPQHLMSASCTVAAMLVVVHYAQRPSPARFVALVLLVVAGFESSVYVGGVTFAAAAMAAGPIVLSGVTPARRFPVAAGLVAAALCAVLLAAPLIRDQLALVAARGGGSPIAFQPVEVLGEFFPPLPRRLLDLPAYWLILLPIEFPATFLAGAVAFVMIWHGFATGVEKTALVVLAVLAGTGLVISWLVVGTLGENNDLGLRAVLPAAMILITTAAAGTLYAPKMHASWRALIVSFALGGLLLSLPDTVKIVARNIGGAPAADERIFAQSPELWAAVRRYAAPTARIANNPLYLQDLTPWPVNISWALLADRSSCFAGREMALAFAPLPPDRRDAIDAQFIRVFAGRGTSADVDDLAKKFGCDVAVVVPQDGAWSKDPFASSADYRLAESRDGQWRIYTRAAR
jgi:hypothetical protein